MTATIREQGRYLLVPVIDDETDEIISWDAHERTLNWSSGEPVATGRTLTQCRRELADWINYERTMRRFGGR
jgi:hypothetical protein